MPAVRTVVVSDLHLGGRSGRDLLRHAAARRALAARLADADRIVLLGDVVELRGLPARDALERAAPALRAIGEASGDAPIVVVPGNHDHRLAAELIERRRGRGRRPALGLEATAKPGRSGPAGRLAKELGAADVTIAYPGVRLRSDVYATHGHHLDCHNSVPALEAVAAAITARLSGGGLAGGATDPDAYEAALSPIYAFIHELSQWSVGARPARGGGLSMRIWQAVNPPDGGLTAGRVLLGGVAIPALVRAVNLTGIGPFAPELTPGALRRAALLGMATVISRLGIDADHVIFGHTHRSGPLADDDLDDGWRLGDGRRLWNSGSWVHEPALIGRAGPASGHWPGTVMVVDDDGPPRLERLLEHVPADIEAVDQSGAG